MKKFERPSLDEVQQLGRRLHRKSVDEIIALLGRPVRELGSTKQERTYEGGRVETVEFSRSVEIVGVGATIYRLVVRERADGKLEFEYHGKELTHDSVA
jgi:hypothetical protein